MTVAGLDVDALVLDRAEYARMRSARRQQAMELRALRRVRLGDRVLLEFENAATLQYQVQEMLYAEGISARPQAVHEVAAYSRLLPGSHDLCATLFIELPDQGSVRAELQRLAGLQQRLRVEVGGQSVTGTEIPGPDEDGPAELTYSVHFVRFHFDDAARDAFRDPAVPAVLVVDHPEYRERAALDGEVRRSLLADLSRTG